MGHHLVKSVLTGALLVGVSLLGSGTLALADELQPQPNKPIINDPGPGGTLKPAMQPALQPDTVASPEVEEIKKSRWIAFRMTKNRFLHKAAAANPAIIAAICQHPGPARHLAKHPHLDEIADADHYLCRRLTRWKGASRALVKNTKALHVISLDPEGIYFAIQRDPVIARYLARQTLFNQMLVENPDLGKIMAVHMK